MKFHPPCDRMKYLPGKSPVMCGRYSLVCIDDLGNRFRVHNPMIGQRSRFNIAPGTSQPVIRRAGGIREMAVMAWGLAPHRAGGDVPAPVAINARAETLAGKPMFPTLPEGGRCLVPASGFFEWKKEGKRKIPFYFRLRGEPLFSFAGLCDTRPGPGGEPRSRFTIITCPPNALVSPVHDRMPAILSREGEERWLAEGCLRAEELPGLLFPYPPEAMEMHPVADLVNAVENDDERVVRPLASSAGRQTLLEE
jgi:putative SOS response-associated peptidase YedK